MTIQRLRESFGGIRYPKGAEAILGELKKCFAALPGIFPRISTKSVQLLVRLTICTLQTQTTLDDDLRQIICSGAACLHETDLVQELMQETAPQTLAQNSEWIHILQQTKPQHLRPIKDGQTFERITYCLEKVAKFVALAPEIVAVFHKVALPPFIFKGGNRSTTATSFLDSAYALKTETTASSPPKLDIPSSSTKMVEEIAVPERLFTCDICQKTFSLREKFVQLVQYHSRVHSHKCNVCSKAFPSSSHLVTHMRTHTGEKPFSCSFCDKSFSQKSSLEMHRRIHTGERPFKCTICPKKFVCLGDLVAHTRTHTGERPFVCSVCNRGFSQSRVLNGHSKTHTGEKPFTCDICNKSFTRNGNLKLHKRIHTRKASYLQLQGSPSVHCSRRDGVQTTSSVSPFKQPSAGLVCNLPEHLAAIDLSKTGSLPSSSLDILQEDERCAIEDVTPCKSSSILLQRLQQSSNFRDTIHPSRNSSALGSTKTSFISLPQYVYFFNVLAIFFCRHIKKYLC